MSSNKGRESKTILIYGDSNTYGLHSKPHANGAIRLPFASRWTSRLQDLLGQHVQVIAEGLPARVAGDYLRDDYAFRNGRTVFTPVLRSHLPVDILIVALGTNDCWKRYDRTADQVMNDLRAYQQLAEESAGGHPPVRRVYYLLPPQCQDEDFDSALYDELTRRMRSELRCIDASDVQFGVDGVHFTEQDHEQVAWAVAGVIEDLSAIRIVKSTIKQHEAEEE